MPDENETKEVTEKWANIVSWVFASIGLIYGCGFLIVFTFFKYWGVDSIVLVEPRYIHVGFLFVMACLVIGAPMFWVSWLLKDKTSLVTSFVREALRKGSGRQLVTHLIGPVRRRFFPVWSVDPTHGIHVGWPVIISMIFILWSFIILVIFAPRDFGQSHPRLAILNFLIPMLVLAMSVLGDLFKEGGLSLYDHAHLRLVRFALRLWWILAGGIYICVFLKSDWFDYSLWSLACFFFIPPILTITIFSCLLFFFPHYGISSIFKADGESDVDTLNKKIEAAMHTRMAVCQWSLYTFQWTVVIAQAWMFIWTVKTDTLK